MVKKFFQLLHKEIGGLHEAAYLLAVFALASQVLGIVRDRFLASMFGAGRELDIYYAAFRIPDFIFVTVASLVSISVLVPFLSLRLERDKNEAREFIDHTFSFFSILIAAVSIGAFILMPVISPKIFSGFTDPSDMERLILLSRMLLLSPILLGISNFFASITQLHKRFFVYALAPVLYNAGIIIGIVALAPIYGNIGIVYGVILGAALHCLIQIPFIIKEELFPTFRFPIRLDRIRDVVALSIPRTLALAVSHIAVLVLVGFASFMAEGSISVFNFSWNLQSVPLTIIGMSYSLAAFPVLSSFFARGERDKFLGEMIVAARHIIFWSMPLTALFIVLRAQVVRTILGASQNFDWNDTRLTAAALALFTISVLAQGIVLLFVRGFYASGNTKTPLYANLFSAGAIIVASVWFSAVFASSEFFRGFIESLLRVEGISGTEVLVLPLAYSVGMILNAVIIWILFERAFGGFSRPVLATLYHSIAASVVMGVASYIGLNIFDGVFDLSTVIGVFLQGFCAGIVGIAVGILMLKLLGNQEISEVLETLHRKIWRVKVVGPDATENVSL